MKLRTEKERKERKERRKGDGHFERKDCEKWSDAGGDWTGPFRHPE